MDGGRSMRAVKNNLPTPSGEVEESEGPRWTRAVGIIPPTPYEVTIRCSLAGRHFEHLEATDEAPLSFS